MYFQDVILTLQRYWASRGCVIAQPMDIECGAGTDRNLGMWRTSNLPGVLQTDAMEKIRTACSITFSSR